MMFLILFFSTAFGATLQIDRSDLVAPIERVSLRDLYPPGISRITDSSKPTLSYGTPNAVTASLVEKIDSLSVSEMLEYVRELIRSEGRKFPGRLVENFHSRYLFSTRFIDVRVLRLLVRIATGRRKSNEWEIQSACDIIDFLQKTYPHVDFNYLTPQYILEWYNILGLKPVVRGQTGDGRFDESFNSSDPQLLALDRGLWLEKFLKPRRDRLQRTGYESTMLEFISP